MNNNIYLIDTTHVMAYGSKKALIYRLTDKKIFHVNSIVLDIILSGKLDEKIATYFDIKNNFKIEILKGNKKNNLSTIYLDITDYCNYSCKNCFHAEEQKTIDDEILYFIQKLKNKPDISIRLLGGEPLSVGLERFAHIHQYIKDFKSIDVFTNASYMKKEFADFIKANNIVPHFTFYSYEDNIHDEYTGVKGSYKKTVDVIRKYFLEKSPYEVNCILKLNELNIEKKFDFIQGAKKIYKDLLRPKSIDDYDSIADRKKMISDVKRPIKLLDLVNIKKRLDFHSCITGKISISTDGKLYPCPWDRKETIHSIYNVSISSFVSFLNNNYWNKSLSSIYSDCSVCEFRVLCNDCIYLNQTLNSYTNSKKPLLCMYNPVSGNINDDI